MLDFLNQVNWWCLFGLLALSFLLGWFLARWIFKGKFRDALDACEKEKTILRDKANPSFANTVLEAPEIEKANPFASEIATEILEDEKNLDTDWVKDAVVPVTEDLELPTKEVHTDQNFGLVKDSHYTPMPTPKLNFDNFGKASASEKDDLKRISGIGPFIEKKLNGIGIYTFDQISRFNPSDIETVTALIEFFPGRIQRDQWKAQAEKLKNS